MKARVEWEESRRMVSIVDLDELGCSTVDELRERIHDDDVMEAVEAEAAEVDGGGFTWYAAVNAEIREEA